MASQRTITVVGSLNTDLVSVTQRAPQGGETLISSSFSTGAGGKGANQAVAAARVSRPNPKNASASPTGSNSDVALRFVGAVGADPFGPALVAGLQADGIDVSGIRVLEGRTTGVAVIVVEEGTGENRILMNPGANFALAASDFGSIESLGPVKPDLVVLQLEIPLETVLAITAHCKEAGVPVLLNPAPAAHLPDSLYKGLEHLILNESEAAFLTGRSAEEINSDHFDWSDVTDEFLYKGVKNVVITLGSRGSFASSEVGIGSVLPARKVKVADTTCAGDTFVGAYATVYVESLAKGDWDLTEAARKASKAAELTVQRSGAQSAIPWGDEI